MGKRFFSFCAVVFLVFLLPGCFETDRSVEVMSFNVRYDNPSDSLNRWGNRLSLIESYLETELPDIVGMQEVLAHQLRDLERVLPGYQHVGVGRADGKEGGEFCPVFFRSDVFELMAKSHFWLSETPDMPGSKSWGAHLPRVVTWVKLKNLNTGHIFFFFNTHLSHVSEKARMKAVDLLLWKMRDIAGEAPVILTGDFNTTSQTATYQNIVGNYDGFLPLWDAECLASGKILGGEISYNGFGKEGVGVRIDFVFVNGYFDVLRHKVDEVMSGGVYISDHFPVSAIIKFSTQLRQPTGETRVLKEPFPGRKEVPGPVDVSEGGLRTLSF